MNKKLYPLQFTPIFKYRIWGGNRLRDQLNKTISEDHIGESWEISAVKGDETLVANGELKDYSLDRLIQEFQADFLGLSVMERFGTDFPLLIKFIDAETPLSIQVHPNDELAKERHNSFGKNEMWYIMAADSDAEIIVGFKEQIDREVYRQKVADGEVLSVLNAIPVRKGDVFNIPTGRVHAIGAGTLLAEIQQTSDVTYRIYDYDRVDASTGKTRELHTELALDAINFEVLPDYKTQYRVAENKPQPLVTTPYFISKIVQIQSEMNLDLRDMDSFVILMAVEGDCVVTYENTEYRLPYGATLLLPNQLDAVQLTSDNNATILMVHL